VDGDRIVGVLRFRSSSMSFQSFLGRSNIGKGTLDAWRNHKNLQAHFLKDLLPPGVKYGVLAFVGLTVAEKGYQALRGGGGHDDHGDDHGHHDDHHDAAHGHGKQPAHVKYEMSHVGANPTLKP